MEKQEYDLFEAAVNYDLTNAVEGVCDAKTRFWIEELNLHQSDQQVVIG